MARRKKALKLSFHGRIIDHLGIQMYQSPVAAIAELISNAWDADAAHVWVSLPRRAGERAKIVIRDDGAGMSFAECESRYLNIGYCRRGDKADELSPSGRPILGRKGIGKLAGFGISETIEVSTTSRAGEKTVFDLRLSELRTNEYIAQGGNISVKEYRPPDRRRRAEHGTTIILKNLTLGRLPSPFQFRTSMARRFLLLTWTEGFRITVNDQPIPETEELAHVQFSFPRDYKADERPSNMVLEDGWGKEVLSSGRGIRWRVQFFESPIEDEELRGVSVFAKVKLAQRPFNFNLSGGLGGQHGLEYMSGQVIADYIDAMPSDLIATERQRINWDHPEAVPLEQWGQQRIKELLRIWRERRGEKRRQEVEGRIAGFSDRLARLSRAEADTVKKALTKLGGIAALSDEQFEDLGGAVVASAEEGRLKNLMAQLAGADDLTETQLVEILVEQEVLTALNIAEAVKTKVLTVAGLKDRIDRQELENAVRDYVATNPWLIDPEFQTYRVERSLRRFLDEMARSARLCEGQASKRVDLVLASGDHLIVIEFMRPGLKLDVDHINRYERYFRTIKTNIEANTGGKYHRLTGMIVADGLAKDPVLLDKIRSLATERMLAVDWPTLFRQALSRWRDFLQALASRTPQDKRLKDLLDEDDPSCG